MSPKLRVLPSSILASALVLSSFGTAGIASAETKTGPYNVLTVKDESGDSIAVNGTNQLANSGKTILFNDSFSYYTETQKGSKEAVLEKIGLNQYKVVKHGDGDSAIPENGLVLSTGSAPGAPADFISQLKDGETVTVYEPVEKSSEMTANAVDPTKASNPAGAPFDGYRGPDQLIVYTPAFGSTTKTNPYGYEITVENGYVTKLGGGGSAIPKNGFVVSGHGIASSWISANSIIGAKVTFDEKGLVKITQDVDSFAFQSKQAIDQAKASIEKAKKEYLDVAADQASASLKKAEDLLSQVKNEADPVKGLDLTRQATQAAYDAYYYSLPSNPAEQRAIWYRPEETTLDGVKQVLDRMEKAGFNSVYLETTFHGYTVFPSKTMQAYGLPAQHPRFQNANYGPYGNDLLKAYIKEAKKRGISIQAWTDGFMVGESSLGMPPELSKYPEWAAVQRQNDSGKPMPDSSSKYYWLDIAQPKVQEFMLSIYKEMQQSYDIKGLDIDYMRYPNQTPDKSYGFSQTLRSMYQSENGVDPYTLDPVKDAEQWNHWSEWLLTKENQFVDKLHTQSKAIDKTFMITATPEPGAEAGRIADWKDDIDGVIPQAYGHDFNSIQKTVQDSKKLMPEGTMYYTGIYSFYHHLSEMAAVSDVMSAKYDTEGVNMFAFGQASAPSVDALGKGPWREKAVNPGENPIGASVALFSKMKQNVSEIYMKQGAVKKKEGAKLKVLLGALSASVRIHPEKSSKVFQAADSGIQQMMDKNQLDKTVGERMKNELKEAQKWVSYYINHQQ
ncbi:family 10 glycosylhydrolase [Metabacillus sp. GX 13764]|uniref:glycoside hydrolase family 10 protein n=1 Tax=Metabacillus kandeliae TaxID=2900151 RepID=UPI001E391672|nr:family 10 glycosylhydrolase [Metabacillus kandeliae]MCD7034613.1 family 10 glycosylhydrolase [Metabacillus kandeliae]